MDIVDLKRKRTAIKSKITRFLNAINADIDADQIDLFIISARRGEIVDAWERYKSIQDSIEEIPDDTGDHEHERESTESNYYKLIALYEKLLNPNRFRRSETPSVSVQNTSETLEFSRPKFKLPEITIPKFSGCYTEWIPFNDAFESLIHSRADLDNIHKFHYLKGALTDVAAELISSLSVSAENYHVAWDLLRETFNNQRLIISKHVNEILAIAPAQKEELTKLKSILNGFNKNLNALKAFNDVDLLDACLLTILSNKLDFHSRKEWESKQSPNVLPKLVDLIKFLTNKIHALESLARENPNNNKNLNIPQNSHSNVRKNQHIKFSNVATSEYSCPICKGNHLTFRCPSLINASVSERLNLVKSKKLCTNCLRSNHFSNRCLSKHTCNVCHKKHNTILHLDTESNQINRNTNLSSIESEPSTSTATVNAVVCNAASITNSLLSTAIVLIRDRDGNLIKARALLDTGSQPSIMREDFAKRLGITQQRSNLQIKGIGSANNLTSKSLSTELFSSDLKFNVSANFMVMPKITSNLPTFSLKRSQLAIPSDIKLADPTFYESGKIDLLINGTITWDVIRDGFIENSGKISYRNTALGWVAYGDVECLNKSNVRAVNHAISEPIENINFNLEKFWQVESVPTYKYQNQSHKICENHFINTTTRDEDGRFVVNLPNNTEKINSLGESKQNALKRFLNLESKFNKQPYLKQQYSEFMNEYETLGHMTITDSNTETPEYYLPHHAVFKCDSLTTKTRVVFDASAKTSSGISLNDALLTGPCIQDDLFDIISRFRKHTYVLTSDITKMYRQILISPEQQQLQKIFWRNNPNEDVKTYKLNTLTYGTAPASFLATRCLLQLANENENNMPMGAEAVRSDFYMDDLLTGADDFQTALALRHEVTSIVQQGGFELRKWGSNYAELLKDMKDEQSPLLLLNLSKDDQIKTLGLLWNPIQDEFQFSVKINQSDLLTKRLILSKTAMIFDPLGLITPFTIRAKIIIQRLWQLKIKWDDPLPLDLQVQWRQFETEIHELHNLKIPRHSFISNHVFVELHGFCDASESAYGANIYAITKNAKGDYKSILLCSKSRVASLKTMSIPRLELCGAVLLVQLMLKVESSLRLKNHKIFYWTDSTIVLAWINSVSNHYQTFVANRIGEIQTHSNPKSWFHVSTAENPADMISRGLTCSKLIESKLWWHGPSWLQQPHCNRPIKDNCSIESPEADLEMKKSVTSNAVTTTTSESIFNTFSSYERLIRVITLCFKFVRIIQARFRKNSSKDEIEPLSIKHQAEIAILRQIQAGNFENEIHCIKNNKQLNSNSPLSGLNPFLDQDNLLRVGGRLGNSHYNFNFKHPIILPKNNHITKIIIRDCHIRNLHPGTQTTLALVRAKFWPINARNFTKKIVRECVNCFKANPKTITPIMGDLPEHRFNIIRPFIHSGVDFFGPISIKTSRLRNAKSVKVYGVIFICLASKAIHLDVAGDLTINSFLSALKRFTARRGKVTHLFSDNATNFVGAKNQLERLIKNQQLQQYLLDQSINWHFIPARSPHFGGLWEAGVKSVKRHLNHKLINNSLLFEELYTLLTQIEAILNSRPLTPISDDPNDFTFLTPAHFICGDSLHSVPEEDVNQVNINRLDRWQYITQIKQHFWKRWVKEYLHLLQNRPKWKKNSPNSYQVGQLVIIKDDNLPANRWIMGRIEQVHPGKDNVIRAATVKTASGILRRAVIRLCPLPVDVNTSS